MFEDLPAKLAPAYETGAANAPILLHEGPCALLQNTSRLNGMASIRLEWLPHPRLAVRFYPSDRSVGAKISLGPAKLDVPGLEACVEATLTSSPMLFWSNETRPTEGRVGRVEFGEVSRCNRVRFHVPNFSFFLGDPVRSDPSSASLGRAVLQHGNFRVTLDRAMPHGHPLEEELPRDGGYAITHVGVIERTDGSTFQIADIESTLSCVAYFLSYCRGAWTDPILLCAEDSSGSVVGQRWELNHLIERYERTMSWLPVTEPVAGPMRQAFRGYSDAWFSTVWGDSIRIATQWYIEGSKGAVEKSIILEQAAFELLAWTRLVEETKVLTVQAWNDRSFHFSKKLRQLLQNCSIPLPIPAELTRLQAYCKAQGILDGPEALTRVRNALVHPTPTKRKLLQQDPGAAIDAWALALWYLDLIILNVCAYNGRYSNRMIGGWRGDEIMKVPWAP
jgi:hypothetical protein